MATARGSAIATPASRNGAHDGGCGQAPTALRNAVPKMPAAEEVTTAENVYVPSRPQPATTPARGPRIAPTKA